MKKIVTIILILALVAVGNAQTITGKLVNLAGNGVYGLKLKLYANSMVYSATSWRDGSFTFLVAGVTDDPLPAGYAVSNNYPNPFNPKTRFAIALPAGGKVSMTVFNILGERVTDDIEQQYGAGTSLIDLELNGLPNGLYFARISLNGKYTVVKKIMLLYGSTHLSPPEKTSISRLDKNVPEARSAAFSSIDSLVVTGSLIARTVFTNFSPIAGNSLNLGNLLVRLPLPSTEIVAFPTDTMLVRNDFTETYTGIQFAFQGTDPNSRTMEYSYSVDSLQWSAFSSSATAQITAAQFRDPYAVRHTFSVRSRNEFGEVDTIGFFLRPNPATISGYDTIRACRVFYTCFPQFLRPGAARQILVINKSFPWDSYRYPRDTPPYPGRTRVENYYRELFSTMGRANYTILTPGKTKFPGEVFLASFSTIVLVCDAMDSYGFIDSNRAVLTASVQKILTDYCYIGGNIVTSSINLPVFYNTVQSDFFLRIFHARPLSRAEIALACPSKPNLTNSWIQDSAFTRAVGLAGYPYLDIDTSKLDPAWVSVANTLPGSPMNHGLYYIWNVLPVDRGESIFQYHSTYGVQCFENSNIGVRYQGFTFNSIFLGFPLYYMTPVHAAGVLNMALSDCGEYRQ